MEKWESKSVKVLQQYLQARGVTTNHRKDTLVTLCDNASKLNIDVDPDGLLEDRTEVIQSKLTCGEIILKNPGVLENFSPNIGLLPHLNIFDIYGYLMCFPGYEQSTFRDYQKMEAYTMAEDGYVLDLAFAMYEEHNTFVAIKCQVKPRTQEKDPISKLGHYNSWLIIRTTECDRILSGYCSCKGGMDGCCRHIGAVLFEIVKFQNDKEKNSVTSGNCLWKKRCKKATKAMDVTLLEISVTKSESLPDHPNEDFHPVPPHITMPTVQDFFSNVKAYTPEACMLDTWEVKKTPPNIQPPMPVILPRQKLTNFFQSHECDSSICGQRCVGEFKPEFEYTPAEVMAIEEATRGQAKNENWLKMRKYLLTASNFKTVCRSRNFTNTSASLLNGPSFDSNNTPAHIEFGNKYEAQARNQFLKGHKFHHKQCHILVPGLMMCPSQPFLGASPDGILYCDKCSTKKAILEIKCLSSKRNFHAGTALFMNKVCGKLPDGTLYLMPNHKYFYQIQGQMAISGIHTSYLVAYTHKGITVVPVEYNASFCRDMLSKLNKFYREAFFQAIKERVVIKLTEIQSMNHV